MSTDIVGILHLFQGCIRYSIATTPLPEQIGGSCIKYFHYDVELNIRYLRHDQDSHLTVERSSLSLVSCASISLFERERENTML